LTTVRNEGRAELAATVWDLQSQDCLTTDPFRLTDVRIGSYMGLLVPIRTGRPTIADGLHVDADDLDLRGDVGGAAANGWPARWGALDSKPVELRIKEDYRADRETRQRATRSRARRWASTSGERTRFPAAVKRGSARPRCSTWNAHEDPKRVWDSRLAQDRRAPPNPTSCGPQSWRQPAAAASPDPSGSR
jgi:hypothetical protein